MTGVLVESHLSSVQAYLSDATRARLLLLREALDVSLAGRNANDAATKEEVVEVFAQLCDGCVPEVVVVEVCGSLSLRLCRDDVMKLTNLIDTLLGKKRPNTESGERDRPPQRKRVDAPVMPRGDDPMPPGPVDPEHPQRIADCTIEKVLRRMSRDGSTAFFCDLKYDGERLLAHKKGSTFGFFSRNMLSVPDRKLDGVREILSDAFQSNDVVIDAEILSKHTFGSQNYVSKEEILSKGPRIFVFDIMWINGHIVTGKSVAARRELLKNVLTEIPGRVEMVRTNKISISAPDASSKLQSLFDKCLRDRVEGLVVKPELSPYNFGGTHWVKLKKGYMDSTAVPDAHIAGPADSSAGESASTKTAFCNLRDTLDVLVAGVLKNGNLLCCVSEKRGSFVTVGTASAGSFAFSSSEKAELATNTTLPKFCRATKKISVEVASAFGRLESCPIVEIASKELVESADHTCNSLAVGADARILRRREDKDCNCTTRSHAVLSLFSEGKVRFRK